jgi:hypothetical protein
MRGAILRGIKLATITIVLSVVCSCRAEAQVHDRYEDWCDSLRNATLPDLVQFLNAVVPDEKNAHCVTWTIHKLGNEHFRPAIPFLVKFLDFRRPITSVEEIFHGLSWEPYPAEVALELMGEEALPEVLHAIEGASTSATARENAVCVWLEIYRQSVGQPKGAPQTEGLARLKLEEVNAPDEGTKQRLRWALEKALTHCPPQHEAACRRAAATGVP